MAEDGASAAYFFLVHDGAGPSPAIVTVAARLQVELGARTGAEVVVQAASFDDLDAALDRAAGARGAAPGAREVFLIPARLGLDLGRRQRLSDAARSARRRHDELRVLYGDPDPCDPLIVSALVDRVLAALATASGPAGSGPMAEPLGLLLVAAGDGDAAERSRSYALMRLVWEHLRAVHADVAFVRHDRPALVTQLDACRARPLRWVLAPAFLWPDERVEYIQVIRDDACRRAGSPEGWPIAAVLGDHPCVTEWLLRQTLALWEDHRREGRARRPSARRRPQSRGGGALCGPRERRPLLALRRPIDPGLAYAGGVVADVSDASDLRDLLRAYGIGSGPTIVKVTWHGYAPGTYTDPSALDALLAALPGRAIVVEGHTASRNLGGAAWDWETESAAHRTWIAEQDREFRERTGLARVLDAHGATYLNVTEAWWDGACAPREQVRARLEERGVTLHHPELLDHVPARLFELAGANFVSYARFKGPTRLSLANLFGLIPVPLRTAWHGPNITYFARVCCDLARLYGTLFEAYGLVESLDVAVRWVQRGLYRSRWGNYDLIQRPGLVCLSRGLATADVLASRLQGQDVRRSAFFDVVRAELGVAAEAESLRLDPELCARLR